MQRTCSSSHQACITRAWRNYHPERRVRPLSHRALRNLRCPLWKHPTNQHSLHETRPQVGHRVPLRLSSSDTTVPAILLNEWTKYWLKNGKKKDSAKKIYGKSRLTKLRRPEKETAKRREAAWKRGVVNAPHVKSKESDRKRRERKGKNLNPRLGYRKSHHSKKKAISHDLL